MPAASISEFVILAVVLAVTPGADTMVVLRNAASQGTTAGLATTVGIKIGTAVHATLASVGVAALLLQYSGFYTVLKVLGAAYLVALGAIGIVRAVRNSNKSVTSDNGRQKSRMQCLAEGFLSNLLNPKVVLFYVAVLPQFIAPGDPVAATALKLGAIHVGASLVWLCLVSFFVGAAQTWLRAPAVRRWVEITSGLAIAAFGLRLAMSTR